MTDSIHDAAVLLAVRTAQYAADATVAVMRVQGQDEATVKAAHDDILGKTFAWLASYIGGELHSAVDEARADV